MGHIGNYIKQLRLTHKMTQEELGEILGVQKAAIQKIEAQQYPNLTAEKIRILSETFKVYPRMFLYVNEEEFLKRFYAVSGQPRVKRIDNLVREQALIKEMEAAIGINALRLLSGIVRLNDTGINRLTTFMQDLHKIDEYVQNYDPPALKRTS